MDDLFEVQAIILSDGWKFILVMKAFPLPLLSYYSKNPSSALNILIMVPLIEAVAINVPSLLTASAPTSLS